VALRGPLGESVWVRDDRRDRVAFDGEVQVSEVTGHPQATRVYAWSGQIGRGPRWFHSVPNIPPVDGPLAAVRSAILDPYRPFTLAEN
jgi:hypothetical protein